jgi:hypothetical protein
VHNEIYRRCNPENGDILPANKYNFATAAMNIVDFNSGRTKLQAEENF